MSWVLRVSFPNPQHTAIPRRGARQRCPLPLHCALISYHKSATIPIKQPDHTALNLMSLLVSWWWKRKQRPAWNHGKTFHLAADFSGCFYCLWKNQFHPTNAASSAGARKSRPGQITTASAVMKTPHITVAFMNALRAVTTAATPLPIHSTPTGVKRDAELFKPTVPHPNHWAPWESCLKAKYETRFLEVLFFPLDNR